MKTLYLREMGMNDSNISTDIKNHRIRTLENIDINYKGSFYNMFFEFTQCNHFNYRKTNKRNGKPLKKVVQELIVKDGLNIDTQYDVKQENGYIASYRHLGIEKAVWDHHYEYTRENILEIINSLSLKKYDRVLLVEEETKKIINSIGGYREKAILDSDSYFQVDMWTPDHKVVKVISRDLKNSCKVDLVTREIVG